MQKCIKRVNVILKQRSIGWTNLNKKYKEKPPTNMQTYRTKCIKDGNIKVYVSCAFCSFFLISIDLWL